MKLAIFFPGMFLNFFKELLQQLFLLDEQTTELRSNLSSKQSIQEDHCESPLDKSFKALKEMFVLEEI